MTNSHTNSAHGTMNDKKDYVSEIMRNIRNDKDIPQEMPSNHVSVGRVGFDYSFYNPHNARFYFRFDKWNFNPDMTLFEVVNSKELAIIFMDCRFVVKKRLVEVTNKIGSERRFRVEIGNSSDSDVTERAVALLELEVVNVFRQFVQRFGGASDFVCIKRHVPDNKILHDVVIDSLPQEVTWNDDVSKKVYKDLPLNVEFKKPVFAANYFHNMGLQSFSPLIASAIDSFHSELGVYTEQIKLHLKVEERQLEVQDETLKTLRSIQCSFPPQVLNVCSNSPLFPVEVHSHEVVGGISPKLGEVPATLPLTISRFDMESKSKEYRLMRARILLNQFGWGGQRW